MQRLQTERSAKSNTVPRVMKTGTPPLLDAPLRFTPFLRPIVWGGRRLASHLGKMLPSGDAYGESWEISDHAAHHSVVARGRWAGSTLRHLMEQHRDALLGSAAANCPRFPWLIKFLDACDWLSVQVHPDESAVARLGLPDGSKTEAWFIIDALPGSRIYAGLLPGVNESSLRAAVAAGKVIECLASFEPAKGDCVFLPAGTVHAVGGGVLFAEVQQTSDVTFRLFDWNRSDALGRQRQLHVEEAMACIHWRQEPIVPVRAEPFATGAVSAVSFSQPLVRCHAFHLDYLQFTGTTSCDATSGLRALIVLAGRGRLVFPGGAEEVMSGQVWLFPAALATAQCRADETMHCLLSSLPPAP
jgi:mannose-6-phosphate isomerase